MTLHTDILIAMNSSSIERFQRQLKKKGLLLFDSSRMNGVVLRDNIIPVDIPAIEIACSAGDARAANMVIPGGLIAATDIFKKSSFDRLFSFSHVPEINKAAEINTNALMEGIKYLENKKSSNF